MVEVPNGLVAEVITLTASLEPSVVTEDIIEPES